MNSDLQAFLRVLKDCETRLRPGGPGRLLMIHSGYANERFRFGKQGDVVVSDDHNVVVRVQVGLTVAFQQHNRRVKLVLKFLDGHADKRR